uniref:Helicase with zinc finger domain 2-like n=1 Tax=Sphaeramia orbicularis TaxID=375764 RepID=A0A672Y8S5_9TELE
MEVWLAEQAGLPVRCLLLQMGGAGRAESKPVTMYCKVCLLVLSSPESFYKHCSSLEHAQLLSEDTSVRWRGRRPPHDRRAEFWMCDRPKTCEYGTQCPKAHSPEELQEWMMRVAEVKQIRQNIESQGLMCYNEKLLGEYRNSSNEVYIVSIQTVGYPNYSCSYRLYFCDQMDVTQKWNFHVETERQLVHVALLKQEPGASFSLGDVRSNPCCIYSSGQAFLRPDATYDLSVTFTPSVPGLYEQWLVLDFDVRPVLLTKLRVRAGQPTPDDAEEPAVTRGAASKNTERWHRGNRAVVPCSSRTEEQEELLKEYKPPLVSFQFTSSYSRQTPLNQNNYKDRMHQFLYGEERAEDQVITTMGMNVSNKTGPGREVVCAVPVPCNLTPDTPEGLALRRSVQSALVALRPSTGHGSKVYEASILHEQTMENQMYLQLSRRCCSDLDIRADRTYEMEVQFQMNRQSFCTMHKAVDLLPDTRRVMPDLQSCSVPVNGVRCDGLNAKQQSAVDFITGDPIKQALVAPLLIYGPFGTGKTFTLATAARELCRKPDNKILICTYTNSSADLYVREHFHPFIDDKQYRIKPIRIKANRQGNTLFATDETTLKYCFLNEKKDFLLPPKAVLDQHNIVITTTLMARRFHELKLPDGYFSHILIDEASQMLECEALMPLGLAGPDTRVVLAGDHMQMGPKLFSVDDHDRSNHTLLTRLFHFYQGQTCETAQNSRIIFSENYRSTQEIVEFVSTHFYVSGDVIKASAAVPPPPDGHALKFFHVRGECILDKWSMSWYNKQEVVSVVEAVKDILQTWPSTWGVQDQGSICVLSEGCQVSDLKRNEMQKQPKNQHSINNKSRQFRSIIITSVHTRDSLETSHLPGLELFNDARVLNTAMTRAQSLVVAVGDAIALCCFGKCSQIWKNFIDHCINNHSANPQYFTKDFFEKEVAEMAKFQKCEPVEENSILTDAILQELKAGYEAFTAECGSAEDGFDSKASNSSPSYDSTEPDPEALALVTKQPRMFKHGTLVRETYNQGYVIPFDSPNTRIRVKGRRSLGRAFTGDEVIVQTATVVSITKEDESARVLVCTLEDVDHSKPSQNYDDKYIRRMMVPITKSDPKIRILISKRNRNVIPIWEQTDGYWSIVASEPLNESLKQNNVFLVQVIGWREDCFCPLGKVIDILPAGPSLDNGLRLLNKEFKVTSTYTPLTGFSTEDEDKSLRKNMREVTTFTIDPEVAEDLDDAISVREDRDHYEVGVHIADVSSFVTHGGKLDEDAKHRGTTYYSGSSGEKPKDMFPPKLIKEHFSLLPNKDRRVVSLLFRVDKKTYEVEGEPKFQLSTIRSDRKLSYKEAEKIITTGRKENPNFDPVECCVMIAYRFAKAQRKRRLKNWVYAQPDEDRRPGQRKAHLMIEELNVSFNVQTSKKLTRSTKTRSLAPLRCQKRPDVDKVEEFRQKCAELIPVSFCVWNEVDCDEEDTTCEKFHILPKVWEDIQRAARDNDIDKMVDLVAADDIHPQLIPLTNQFRKCSNKAYVIRSNSSEDAKVGHYSLKVNPYTYASSPIRRYMDVVLQRLLHSVICEKNVPYTTMQITSLCNPFEQKMKDASEYEKKAEKISYAVSMRKQNVPKLAFVVNAEPDTESFLVAFPFNKNVFPENVPVMYRDLQLEDQPLYDEDKHCITLLWRRRIYAANKEEFHQQLKTPPDCGPRIELPGQMWKSTIEAIKKETWDDAKKLILSAETKPVLPQTQINSCPSEQEEGEEEEHEVDISLLLRPGDTLQVQMTSELKRAYLIPAIQLVNITPKFEVCVEHVHNPITCFSQPADNHSKLYYRSPEDYVNIWKPLCKMESAFSAVREGNSIIIEDLVVKFSHQEDTLTGSFFLPQTRIEEWAIECNLSKCLLCVRKRGLDLISTLEESHPALVDPDKFTWVAHGVTTQDKEKKSPSDSGRTVNFYINYLPMKNIPDCIYKSNTMSDVLFCLYFIFAVLSGSVVRRRIPGMSDLNYSQLTAVDKAIENTFTLIQGPPGTGKTIVGAYIVHCFFELNLENPWTSVDPKDQNKKSVILYCGPSNKSVDVVAEFLLKFGGKPKLLRVYGQQVEMVDYPFPECRLQFSHMSRRNEPANPKLRSITLHHRMREPQNPFSTQIRAFDKRIKAKEHLTADEVKEYKQLLQKARIYELERHDVILCTCTQASTPSLTKTVSARQILIDECAMATEPQAMIPLVCNKPEKIVLIGDHKQLRPIVLNEQVRKLGMSRSLFERYYTTHEKRAVMLDTQYRMHRDICRFPSEEFYNAQLKTGVEQPNSVLLVDKVTMPIVFGDIRGKTVSLVVSTAKGNENSKANREERKKVVEIAQMLVENAKIQQQGIVIISPYNAQVSEIKMELKEKKMEGITVTTVTKSQGSEWRYVIISTVCSVPSEEMEVEPERGWLSKHLGFVGDPNQINVAITRAKEGLCIIGKKKNTSTQFRLREVKRTNSQHFCVQICQTYWTGVV